MTESPRCVFDTEIAVLVDQYGDSVVRAVIHRILDGGVPFRPGPSRCYVPYTTLEGFHRNRQSFRMP